MDIAIPFHPFKFNFQLFMVDGKPLKFYLNGYENSLKDLIGITKIIEAFGGSLADSASSDVITFSNVHQLPESQCQQSYDVLFLHDSIVRGELQDLELYRIPLHHHKVNENPGDNNNDQSHVDAPGDLMNKIHTESGDGETDQDMTSCSQKSRSSNQALCKQLRVMIQRLESPGVNNSTYEESGDAANRLDVVENEMDNKSKVYGESEGLSVETITIDDDSPVKSAKLLQDHGNTKSRIKKKVSLPEDTSNKDDTTLEPGKRRKSERVRNVFFTGMKRICKSLEEDEVKDHGLSTQKL